MVKEELNQCGYVIISPAVMSAKDLTLTQKVVLGRITGLINKFGYCFATNGWLGKELGLSSVMLRKHIYKLIDLGYLRSEVDTGNNRHGSIRRLYPTEKILTGGGVHKLSGGCEDVNRGVIIKEHPKDKNISEKDLQSQGFPEVQIKGSFTDSNTDSKRDNDLNKSDTKVLDFTTGYGYTKAPMEFKELFEKMNKKCPGDLLQI